MAATAGITAPQRWTRLQLLVVAACTLINALDGMDVLIISIVAPAIATDWGVGFGALGIIFSAGLLGMMIGCIAIAPLADRVGRRPMVLAGLALITIGMIGSGLAGNVPMLVAGRVIAGLGIGTLLATIAALVSEFAPPHARTLAIGWFQAGYPVGAVLTGMIALWALPAFGWQAMLIGAGCMSAALLPVIWRWLPESAEFLASRTRGEITAGVPLRRLFDNGLWRATVTLWVATLFGFAVLYFVTSWITKLAVIAGLDQSDAIRATTIFNAGGFIGGLLIGALAMRRRVGALILGFFVIAAVLMLVFSLTPSLTLILLAAFGLGITLQGGFTGFYSLAAQLYPVSVRGAGIGWALGFGRGGSIISPIAGAWLLDAGFPLWAVFACFAVPLVAGGALAALTERLGGPLERS